MVPGLTPGDWKQIERYLNIPIYDRSPDDLRPRDEEPPDGNRSK